MPTAPSPRPSSLPVLAELDRLKPSMSNDGFTSDPNRDFSPLNDKSYALSGKIMLSAIVILFFVVILMVCLHLYARWYLLRVRRRNSRRNRHRRSHLVFHVDPASVAASTRGLDPAVLNSLPVFVYSAKTHLPESDPDHPAMECAVCLSEFEENETGRRLPKCNHSFHTECIDMWFHSHSTCPLCRSPVEPGPDPEIRTEVCIVVGESGETEPGQGPRPSSAFCSDCNRSSSSVASSSFGGRRKPFELVGVSIEVPRRNESFGRLEDESGCNSPAGQTTSFRSPMSRMLSFKRILSRERRAGGLSPSGHSQPGCSAANELDMERGKDPTQ
ncbi:43kDa postsynaptic protein [Parasponia andersonii]|uniref:RING-type E3 ubiquitin transferase n=1 Tax=Parasponia andersonii TaxID=3476 RepID=A0A2P5CLT3_PARAD|nr:43kDa postsynaptic protein [Parasponia andersonii]